MARLSIEVVYATASAQQIERIELEEGATAMDAFRKSGLARRVPEIDPLAPMLGVFGLRVAPQTPLRDGDRVEIYRPLALDPKEARRAKASATRKRKF